MGEKREAREVVGRDVNRLARESSPYLRQHAHNPVDWYPWGEEALARAKAEERPIFLSIGYAACHWCHVMEHESFEDAAVAALLNQNFVAIKVDREERPDLDAVYMNAVQAMTGSGGWPLSVFLTPNLKPFFGGTYFPPERRSGMASFREVLLAVADAWQRRRQELETSATGLVERLSQARGDRTGGAVDVAQARRAALASLASQFDARWGGFGSAPKFPTPSRLFFLLRLARADAKARQMLATTLDGMAAGGMCDWLGGGFHRYSVDETWLVPHFEKMLYDNALLARVYAEAGMRLGNPAWMAVARATANYLLREMRSPEGAFFSSTDADSEGHEGTYFTWTPTQIREVLPADQAELVIAVCALGTKGNFEGDASVLRPTGALENVAAELRRAPGVVAEQLASAKATLLRARSRRTPPATDDKRLAGWNGMAVWSLAYLGAALPEPRYLEAARGSAAFLLAHRLADGRLARSWRDGVTSGTETLEDVAWVSAGLVQLYEADGEVGHLTAANELIARRLPHYQDSGGTLFDSPDDGPALIMRPRSPLDNAILSATAVLAATLLRLSALTGDDTLRGAAERALAAEAAMLERYPEACLELLAASVMAARPAMTLVIVGDPAWDSTRRLAATTWREKPADCALAISPAVPVPPGVVGLLPLFAGREVAGPGEARAYLCEGGACRLPASDPEALARALADLAG